MPRTDSRERLQTLRKLLEESEANTQEDLREKLEALDFEVTQSTISRDLKRLGAIKRTNVNGETVYRLETDPPPSSVVRSISDLVRSIRHNGMMVVVTTDIGSASLIARHVDALRSDKILGTIAGDDCVFIAPSSAKVLDSLVKQLEESMDM